MHSPASSEILPDFPSLARTLSAADGRVVVWKGGGDLTAQGDLDCSAPRAAWPALARAFASWARSHELQATITCDHVIGQRVLVGCGGAAGARLVQVDLVDELVVHGTPVWNAEDARAASVVAAGIARTLPGAEGILRRLADRSDRQAAGLVAADPSGAVVVSQRLGVRGRLARADGPSSRVTHEALLAVRPLLHAAALARAVRSNGARNACPVLRALRNDRTLDAATEPWLAAVSRTHEVERL
jgi:riboflavin biosynthesis pyrimidine reductase